MDKNFAYNGSRLTLIWAMRTDDSMPALEFFQGLDQQWQRRFLTLFAYLGDQGRIRNPEQFTKFGDDFWEFKAFRYRLPCYFRADQCVVITHGFEKKKEGRAPPQENERARLIRAEYEARLKPNPQRKR